MQFEREVLRLLFGDVCVYCEVTLTDETRSVDHLTPKSRQGTNHLENLRLACIRCNQRKRDRTVLEYLGEELPAKFRSLPANWRWVAVQYRHAQRADERGRDAVLAVLIGPTGTVATYAGTY
jgi:CRISPR/Cas system Type II protein with McrA/HNH and RuvC-like nuclease domain